MKKTFVIMVVLIIVLVASCATGPSISSVEGLLSLDEALTEITSSVETKVTPGTEVGIAKVEAPLPELADFLYDEFCNSLGAGGKMVVLAGGKDAKIIDAEQERQMSGMVSDASAVGIGKYLGAKVMISVSFTRYANFSQLFSRALDVETGAMIASNRSRIYNNDPLLVNVTAPLQKTKAAVITYATLEHLNLGKDYLAAGLRDPAIEEFSKALAINKELDEAWYNRGVAYCLHLDLDKGEQNKAIADITQAIKLNPYDARYYYDRGEVYDAVAFFITGDWDKALADYTQAIRLNPNDSSYYLSRSSAYIYKEDYNRALADCAQAIRLNPNDAVPYSIRARIYSDKNDYDRAITEYDQAISIDPNDAGQYVSRGEMYTKKGNYDQAIADFTQAIRLDLNSYPYYYLARGLAYEKKGYYTNARADYTKALQLSPNYKEAQDSLAKLGNRGK